MAAVGDVYHAKRESFHRIRFQKQQQLAVQRGQQHPKLLFLNQRDGTFKDVSKLVGPALETPQVSRGLAVGDLFNDGRLEVVIENLKGGPMILQPQGVPDNHWISFELEGTRSNRLALKARVRARAGNLLQESEILSGGSYLSQNDLRIHFGLGTFDRVEQVEILWPPGEKESLQNLPANHFYKVREGKGVVGVDNASSAPSPRK
jgi:hypothetical protein